MFERAAVVLASASPRRRTLLAAAGLLFDVAPVDVDEDLGGFADADEAARRLAERKGRAAGDLRRGQERFVLAADTVVALVGTGREELLGKPTDAVQAAAMLERLSDSRHAVVTGLCVLRCRDGEAFVDHERTWVHMRPIRPEERAAYVASGEWRDKAGGYAIQETADAFVTRLEGGGFDNVVGLPVARALALLRRAGAPEVPEEPGA